MLLAHGRNVALGRLRKRQPSERVLGGDFPGRRCAQEHLVIGRAKELPSRLGQSSTIRDHPEERARVEEKPHPRRFFTRLGAALPLRGEGGSSATRERARRDTSPSNVSTTSSGSGSKNA